MNKKSPIRAKDENAPLPVAVRGSKTPVLKLSNSAILETQQNYELTRAATPLINGSGFETDLYFLRKSIVLDYLKV